MSEEQDAGMRLCKHPDFDELIWAVCGNLCALTRRSNAQKPVYLAALSRKQEHISISVTHTLSLARSLFCLWKEKNQVHNICMLSCIEARTLKHSHTNPRRLKNTHMHTNKGARLSYSPHTPSSAADIWSVSAWLVFLSHCEWHCGCGGSLLPHPPSACRSENKYIIITPHSVH